MALLCVTRHVTSGESAHHLRCVLPYYAVRDIRHGVRCPGNDVNRFMCVPGQISLEKSPIRPYRTISAITHRRNSGLLDLHTLSAHGMVCPGSQKEAKITNRDNEIWPGSHVNRLPSPPGHRLRIDKMLQCLTGMRPYRDSNVSLEVEESSSTPQTGSNAPNHRAPCLVWRITASSGVDVAGQQRNLRCMMRPKTKKPGGGGRRVREKREEGFSYGVRKNLATGMNFIPLTSSI